jgi:hypothetical protein
MSKKTIKPATAYAKADAKLVADCRKVYPEYDNDVAAYGRPAADYNAGFVAGDENGREVAAKASLPVIRDLSTRVSGKWSKAQRRAFDRLYTLLTKHAGN